MTESLFEQVEAVGENDEVRVVLDADSRSEDGADRSGYGTEFASPFTTRVRSVDEDTLDSRRKDVDADGIVYRRTLHLEPMPDDEDHDEYVIETRSPVVGSERVLPLRARKRLPNGADEYETAEIADVSSLERVDGS